MQYLILGKIIIIACLLYIIYWGIIMDSREFIKKYKDDIICEPSGRTYAQLKKDRVTKMMIVNKMKHIEPLDDDL
jgi:hypothetical protein